MCPPDSGHAIRQRDGLSLAVVPHFRAGLVTPVLLRRVADLAERYGVQVIKLTSGGRMALIGLTEKNVAAFWKELGVPSAPVTGNCVRNVRCCPGTETCKYALGDALRLGMDLDAKFLGWTTPGPCKISVSGCSHDCSEAAVRDVGLVAQASGWRLVVGGNVGRKPRIGRFFAYAPDEDAARSLVEAILAAYAQLGKKKERLGAVLERVGLEAFSRAVEDAAIRLAGPAEQA